MSHPEAFVPNVAGAWIHPDAALAAKVIRSGMNCPSGAIRVLAQDGSTSDAPPVVNTLRLREIGPLALEAPILLRGEMRDTPPAAAAQWAVAVAGAIEVVTGTGQTVNRATEVVLCRCGQSRNKPCCDGSHKAAGFLAD